MYKKYYSPAKFVDLQNKRFGFLIAIEFVDFRDLPCGKYSFFR